MNTDTKFNLTSKKVFLLSLWISLAVVYTSTFQTSPFFTIIPRGDSAVFITCAQWMKDGLVMYRDIFDHKGIFIYLFDIIGLSIGGLTGIWTLCVIWLVFSTYFTYKLCRLYANKKASYIASTIALLMFIRTGGDNTVELVSLPFVSFLYWRTIQFIQKKVLPTVIEFILYGFFLTIIVLLKPNIVIGAIVPLVLLVLSNRNKFHTIIFALVLIIMGAIATTLPFLIYLIKNNALLDFYSTFWLFNIEYSTMNNLSIQARCTNIGLLFFSYIPSILSWIAIIFVLFKESKQYNFRVLVVWLLISGFFNAGLSGFNFPHYLLPIMPIFTIFIAKLFFIESKLYKMWQISYLLLCFSYFSIHFYKSCSDNRLQQDRDKATISLSSYIKSNTQSTDKIVTWGKYSNRLNNLFFLSDRKSVTKYIYQVPIFSIRPQMEHEFIESIISQRPKMIITGTMVDLTPDIAKHYIKIDSGFSDVFIYSRQ